MDATLNWLTAELAESSPVKICFLMYQGNMYSGGQGVYLFYLTRELARMGHEVHVIAGPPYPHAR